MAEVADGQARKELTRAQLVALWAGRALFFLPVALFVAFWAWYFVAVLRAGQYPWAFWSLLLFSLFLFASRVTPSGRALRMELGLASARMLIEWEKGAEAIVEQVKAAIPEGDRKAVEAVEAAKARLFEEARRASERALMQALLTATTPTAGAMWPFPLGDLGDIRLAEPISRYIREKWSPDLRVGTPVTGDQSEQGADPQRRNRPPAKGGKT